MNYDVLLNRTGFNKLSITPQHFRSVSEGDSRNRDQPQVADRSGDGTKTPGRKISLPPHAHRHETMSASCSPMRGGPSANPSASGPGEEFKGKVESKLLTMWNNMKFGWSYKMKTNFSKEQPLWLLGRCYHQKVTPGPSMESSLELGTSGPDGQLMVLQNVYLAEGSNSPPEETGTDAIEDSSPEAIIEEEGIGAFRRDFISRIWMTYRREFQTMDDSNYTSDCGWGCMIRSGQMLLAQGLVAHFLGRSWRWDVSMFTAYEESIHRKVIRWFGDTSSKTSPFSIHTLVALGKESGKKPGDWYGPGAVAHLLRQAVRLAAQEITDLDGVNVYVAQDCAVYIQDILDECTVSAPPPGAPWQQKCMAGSSGTSANVASVHKSDSSPSAGDGDDEGQSTHWKSLILLVPLRLGTDKLNPIYNECLKAMLSLDYCIGIIGGRPKHSLYFVGYQEDKLIHLDPHYCQDMVDVNQENFPVASFHCKSPRKMKLSKMDPSCCIGFYCETKRDFYKFIDSVKPFLIPVHQGNQEAGFTNPSGSSTSSVSYPMFVFCRGKSSEQRADLPGQQPHHSHPMAYRSPPTAIPQQMAAGNDEDDDEEEDEAIEFVIL
ncbi:cysteine protease ATG4C [Anopheles funestus]|uniref:cysteine protease ATG4C n=1 Tax=Anopheles funestus TaxID=62324 RepID=UPI0020C69BAF|nr:cysteine protease ATG4C [Anopheles funestus]XP_049285801.1 cysteine protease ATG4C [Anopheles funestus]